MSDATGSWQHRRAIRAWLVLLLGAVILTILVGGATRLLDAGLSITEWKPVTGILPPFGNADWLSEFEKYKQIPEFTLQNSQMSLAEFKSIYWLEWGHVNSGESWASFGWSGSCGSFWAGNCGRVGQQGCCCSACWEVCRVRSDGGWSKVACPDQPLTCRLTGLRFTWCLHLPFPG